MRTTERCASVVKPTQREDSDEETDESSKHPYVGFMGGCDYSRGDSEGAYVSYDHLAADAGFFVLDGDPHDWPPVQYRLRALLINRPPSGRQIGIRRREIS